MPADSRAAFETVFAALKPVLAKRVPSLTLKADTANEFSVATQSASPFPQHKGQPLDFGSVRLGKAYVSVHLMPLYMCPVLAESLSPALKKRMQGKTCFSFKEVPSQDLLDELDQLTEAALAQWAKQGWL